MLSLKSKYPIAIDLGSQSIYAVQLKQTRKGLAVRALAHTELESEIDSTPDADHSLVSAVKKMTKNGNFRGKRVALHIPVKSLSVFPLRFQVGKDETPEEVIIREAEKYLSFPLEEALIDYPSLISGLNGDDDTYKSTVIAARREVIDQYLDLMKQAGLIVEVADYRLSSLIRLHDHFHKVSRHPVILCNIGSIESLLTIVTQDGILGQRIIPWGIQLPFEKILANLELSNSKTNAKHLLKTHGLAYEDLQSTESGVENGRDEDVVNIRRAIYQVITPCIDELVNEFHKMTSYVRSEQQHPFLEGIYMYGQAAMVYHLDCYFEKRLNMPTRCVNPLTEVAFADDHMLPDSSEGAPFALALGLAMRKVTWL